MAHSLNLLNESFSVQLTYQQYELLTQFCKSPCSVHDVLLSLDISIDTFHELKRPIDSYFRVISLEEHYPSSVLSLSSDGLARLEAIAHTKRSYTKESRRYWITTAIAIVGAITGIASLIWLILQQQSL